MAKREFATYRQEQFEYARNEQGKRVRVSRVATSTVRVMAVAEGYAMVRYPACMPFVVSEKDLRERETRA